MTGRGHPGTVLTPKLAQQRGSCTGVAAAPAAAEACARLCAPLSLATCRLAAALSLRRHFNKNWAEPGHSQMPGALGGAEVLQCEHKTHRWGCELLPNLRHLHWELVSEQLWLLRFNARYRSDEGGL